MYAFNLALYAYKKQLHWGSEADLLLGVTLFFCG
jgi:hypothetical protein